MSSNPLVNGGPSGIKIGYPEGISSQTDESGCSRARMVTANFDGVWCYGAMLVVLCVADRIYDWHFDLGLSAAAVGAQQNRKLVLQYSHSVKEAHR